MSTKNLARTVIEGGRAGFSKWGRRHRNRLARGDSHWACHKLTRDPSAWDDIIFEPLIYFQEDYEGVVHNDKTNCCDRFLRSRVGRPWTKVRAEIYQTFDRRTVAGRHIVYDHLLNQVEDRWPLGGPGVTYYWHGDYWIDRQGLLQSGNDWRTRPWPSRPVLKVADHIGSTVESFYAEEGLLDEVTALAAQKVELSTQVPG